MFKRRRRSVAATAGSDLPFCAMCGDAIRVDANSGRCALGHRVATVPAPQPLYDAGTPIGSAEGPVGGDFVDRYSNFNDAIAWEPAPGANEPVPASSDALDEFIAWEQPGGGTLSALDVDTHEFPVAQDLPLDDEPEEAFAPTAEVFTPTAEAFAPTAEVAPAPPAAPVHDLGADLLDELDDAAHARRQAVGTIGATIAVSGMVFVAVAALPF